MSTALIVCGALGRELRAIVAHHGWDAQLLGIPASDHMTPEKIPQHVEGWLLSIRRKYERVLVVLGDCGTYGALDRLLERHGVERISGLHCYEMYAGADFDALLREEPGTFFLTDFLVRAFEQTIVHGMGLDRHPELKRDYFRHYRRLVYLIQQPDEALLRKAEEIASYLGLSLETRVTGYGYLEQRLVDWFAAVAQAEEDQPCRAT